jgi:hypothetical protein
MGGLQSLQTRQGWLESRGGKRVGCGETSIEDPILIGADRIVPACPTWGKGAGQASPWNYVCGQGKAVAVDNGHCSTRALQPDRRRRFSSPPLMSCRLYSSILRDKQPHDRTHLAPDESIANVMASLLMRSGRSCLSKECTMNSEGGTTTASSTKQFLRRG